MLRPFTIQILIPVRKLMKSPKIYCVNEQSLLKRNSGRRTYVERKYIVAVKAMDGYVLQVDFVSGACLLLDMKPYLDKIRFRPLSDPQVWNSAVTNGIFVRFGNVELSHDEILSMAEQEHNSPNI